MPVIQFNDGSKVIYKNSISLKEILKHKNSKIVQSIISASINGSFSNLNTLITKDSSVSLITKKDIHALNIIRYSCIQLLNYAIKTIWPLSRIAGSQIIKNGFCCDVDLKDSILEKDLILIEKKMKAFLNKKYNILNKKVSFEDALKEFEKRSEIYKIKLIKDNF